MMQSLAQWVASRGGLKPADDENGYIRELNSTLRGRNSVVRKDGESFDRLANDARDAGFAVTEFDFVEKLFLDALAWANGEIVRNRIYPAYMDWDLDQDLGEWYAAETARLLETCKVCGAASEHGICDSCCSWAVEAIGSLVMNFFDTVSERERWTA